LDIAVATRRIGSTMGGVDQSGRVLLVCRWRRSWSAFMTGGFLLGIVVLGNSLGPQLGGMGAGMPGFLRLLCALIALAMGAGFVASGRLLLWPPVMFAATEKGIVSYFAGGRYGGSGTLIPWERIVDLAYVERVVPAPRGLCRLRTIAIKVDADASWRAPLAASFTHDGSEDTIHLDASTGEVSGPELLAKLRESRPAS
jgi:hypothetical protein